MTTYAYVANNAGTVSVINTSTNAVTATIAVGSGPYKAAVTPDGTKAYVANSTGNSVSVINTSTNAVTSTIAVGSGPTGIAVSPDGTKAYVANGNDNTVSVINTSTNAVTATIAVGTSPKSVAVSPDGTKAYVTNYIGNSVSVINTSTNAVIATIAVTNSPNAVVISPDGTKAYVTNYTGGTVSVINASTNAIVATITVGSEPNNVAVSPDGTKAYVTNSGSNSVSVINTSTNAVTATITVGSGPVDVAFASPTSLPAIVQFESGQTYSNQVPLYAPSLVSGATAQRIQRAPDVSGSPGTFADIGTEGGISNIQPNVLYLDSGGIAQLTTYWYRAVATESGTDYPGQATSYTTPGTQPPQPVISASNTFTAPLITMTTPANFAYATNVALQRLAASGGTWTTINGSVVAGNVYTDSPPENINNDGSTAAFSYTYRYVATETPGAGGAGVLVNGLSSTLNFGPPPPPPPSAPAAPTFGSPGPNAVPVILPPLPANASYLQLQRAPDVSGSPGAFNVLPGATNLAGGSTFTDTGLTTSTRYWYRVVAVGNGGSTTGPDAAGVTSAPVTTPPIFSSASVNAAGNSIAWVFADSYSVSLLPAAPTGLSATADGAAITLGTASVSGMVVTTPITSAVIKGGQVCLGSYTPGNLTDNASPVNAVAAFTNQPITNNSGLYAALSASITAPAAGATVQGLVAATVAASGGTMGVSRVELYVSRAIVDTATVPTGTNTYTLHWDTTASGNATFVLTAVAYDYATPPNSVTSAPVTVTVVNPNRLSAGYWFSAVLPVSPEGTLLSAVVTADIVPTTDKRSLREILFGVNVPGTSVNFETDYTLVALNEDFLLPGGGGSTYRLAAKLVPPYTVSPFTFTGQVKKMIPFGAAGLIWTTDGKLWSFDGVSAPALLLDTAPLLLTGESLRDVCVFAGRVVLALSGGSAPLSSRLFIYDPAPGYESDTTLGFTGTAAALATTSTNLYLGTSEGYIHQIGLDWRLKKICGGTTAALPAAVSALLSVALSATNTAPGVAAALADGSVWDIDGTAVYGATRLFAPPDGAVTAAVAADLTYLASVGGGLYARETGGFVEMYTFPHGVNTLAAYGATLYAGLSSDGRLWGKTLSPGAHSLAYGPVTDSLGYVSGGTAGLTGITALLVIGSSLYLGGTAGTGENTVYEYQAPNASALGVFGLGFKHPALEIRQTA